MNKFILKKFFLTLGIIIISIIFLSGAKTAQAKNCGGGVVCACGDTVTASTTTGDIGNMTCTGNGLIVGANNITIDGGGHTITGNNSGTYYGINDSGGYGGITIQNFGNITHFGTGIYLNNSTGDTIQNNVCNSNINSGIYLLSSNSNTLTNNTADSNSGSTFSEGGNAIHAVGIYLRNSSNNYLGLDNVPGSGNTTNTNSNTGIYIYGSSNVYNYLNYNTANSNGIWGILSYMHTVNVLIGNTTNSNSYYGVESDGTSDTLNDNTANSNLRDGFYFYGSAGTITNNVLENNSNNGIRMFGSSGTIGANTIYANNDGIYLNNSALTVATNIINSNTSAGIYFDGSGNDIVANNTFYNTLTSFAINQIDDSDYLTFENNIIYGGEYVSVESGSDFGSVYNYNDYYGGSGNYFNWIGTNYTTFSDWQTNSSQDANSINSDPKFNNAAGDDFSLQSSSPVIDVGTASSTTTDFLGNPIYGTPDIGAYEYQPPHNLAASTPDTIDIGAGARIYADGKFRDLGTTNSTPAHLKVAPQGGSFTTYAATTTRPAWLDVTNITNWTNTHKTWTESNAQSSSMVTDHTVGDLDNNKYYIITVTNALTSNISGINGTTCSTINGNAECQSNGSGTLSFEYNGGYSTHTLDMQEQSSDATVTSSTYTVSSLSGNNGTITNIPYNTSKATFESNITKGQANQTWTDTGIHNPVLSGDTLVVTAQDGVTQATYTITAALNPAKVITAFNFNALSPAVTGTINGTAITATVPYGTNVTALVATFTTTGSSVKVGSTVQTSGTTPNDFTNPVTYTVTAADSSTQNYTVTVTVVSPNTDATLSSLTISQGTLSPSFSSAVISYTDNVSNSVTSLTVTPTVNQANATITVDGNTVASGSTSGAITLNVGSGNSIVTVVTAQNGVTTGTYTITVTRALPNYTLTYTAGSDGSIAGSLSQTVISGSSGSAVTAVPNTGYYFVNWSDGSTANPRTDTNVIADISVTANFVAEGGGSMPPAWLNTPSPPAGGFSVSINNGAISTLMPEVTLNLKAGSDTAKMAVSNFSDFRDASQENYTIVKAWNLCWNDLIAQTPSACPAGTYTVYAKFYTQHGQPSEVVTSSIVLQSSSPSNSGQTTQATSQSSNVFTQNLRYGSNNKQVTLLQNILKKLGFFPKSTKSNGNFGPTTLKAVEDFQVQYNIAKPSIVGYGQVGPKTRQALNQFNK